jgi:hypothetical protein
LSVFESLLSTDLVSDECLLSLKVDEGEGAKVEEG